MTWRDKRKGTYDEMRPIFTDNEDEQVFNFLLIKINFIKSIFHPNPSSSTMIIFTDNYSFKGLHLIYRG